MFRTVVAEKIKTRVYSLTSFRKSYRLRGTTGKHGTAGQATF